MKAIVLLSGGLDSTLAVKLMIDQGIDLVALNFVTPFCNCTAKSSSCKHEATRVAQEFGIPIRVRNKGLDYLEVVRNPKHGYGRGMNPCIDCRIFMHREARTLMAEEGAQFIVTGEVLGQRPMSQRRPTLRLIEKDSGTEDLILRPLSAHHFEPTLAEREGWVDRDRLLAIEGRSRKEQIQLASDLGVADYPCPAGGCLLTDPSFAARIRDLFAHNPGYDLRDVRLLRSGRHFRVRSDLKWIVGRDEGENEAITRGKTGGDTVARGTDFNGPDALTRDEPNPEDLELIGRILLRYAHETQGTIEVVRAGTKHTLRVADPLEDDDLARYRVAP